MTALMQDTLSPPRVRAEKPCAPPAPAENTAATILRAVFDVLDEAGLRYSMLHGYDDLERIGTGDVDCVIDSAVSPREICALIHGRREEIGADLVRCRGYLLQLAGRNADGSACFLTLDLSRDAGTNDLTFYTGGEVLKDRRRVGRVWVPSVAVEFGSYLARSIAKDRLEETRTRRLAHLFAQDPAGCTDAIGRFWSGPSAELLLAAARTGEWSRVRIAVADLKAELVSVSWRRYPGRMLAARLGRVTDRLGRLARPDGVSVVVLGPDGAGKSSTTDAIGGDKLIPAFDGSVCWGFVPPLHRLIGRNLGPSSDPHGLPPRSLLNSTLRATYWFLFSTLGYARVHLALARSRLVLYDRHFVDILVDPKRYRYSGPMWPMRLIWRLIPKPDLVILLDAPAELVQARKKEVPLAETVRQRKAYLALVRELRNGKVVDASQPFDRVTEAMTEIVIEHLRARTLGRLGFGT